MQSTHRERHSFSGNYELISWWHNRWTEDKLLGNIITPGYRRLQLEDFCLIMHFRTSFGFYHKVIENVVVLVVVVTMGVWWYFDTFSIWSRCLKDNTIFYLERYSFEQDPIFIPSVLRRHSNYISIYIFLYILTIYSSSGMKSILLINPISGPHRTR